MVPATLVAALGRQNVRLLRYAISHDLLLQLEAARDAVPNDGGARLGIHTGDSSGVV
jgi:hypothetical protein